jgi:hypothetical protein
MFKRSSTDSAEVFSTVRATCSIRRWISVVYSLKQPRCNRLALIRQWNPKPKPEPDFHLCLGVGTRTGLRVRGKQRAGHYLTVNRRKQMKGCDGARTQMHSSSRSSIGHRRFDVRRRTAARGHPPQQAPRVLRTGPLRWVVLYENNLPKRCASGR